MIRMAWIGWDYFLRYLPADTFEVRTIAFGARRLITWDAICQECGGQPDVVVYCDRSIPPPLPGVEHFPCLTVFYCIDSHIHDWYPTYAQAFDLCTVSLRDHLPRFQGRLTPERLLWMPPSATAIPPEAIAGESTKTCDMLFVGKVDPELTPQRARMLAALGDRLPGLVVTRGDWRALFPSARLVLNIAEGGDLNFRVFEALSVGSCLLTPEVGHGLTELFVPGEHLFTYPADDVDALASLAQTLLPDAQKRATVARQGLETLRAHHGPDTRAAQFTAWLTAQPAMELVRRRLDTANDLSRLLRLLYLHWAEALPGDPRAAIYLEAAKTGAI
jgi:hypothetical protein